MPDFDEFLKDPSSSYEFVTWLRRFIDDPNPIHTTLLVVFGEIGTALSTGIQGDVAIKFPCTIAGWTLLADQTGSIVVDIWKDKFANYPPLSGKTIVASSPPTISSAQTGADIQLPGWTRAINADDTLRFSITSVTSIQQCTLALQLVKPFSHP